MSTQKQIIEEFKKRFGVSVVAAKDSLEIDVAYLEADEEKTSAYIESFLSKELSLYSTKVLKKSNLRKIILCKNLVSSGKKRAGLAEPKWIFSVLLGNNILINVDAPLDSYARSVIHHELYHLIDDSDDINGMYDNHWKKLNHPNFIYKDDHLPNQLFKASSKGFVSTYAMTAVHEDKADTFSHMIVDYKGIEKLAKTDAVLRRKMERMKVLMNKFSSEFDDSFWRERAKMSERLVRY